MEKKEGGLMAGWAWQSPSKYAMSTAKVTPTPPKELGAEPQQWAYRSPRSPAIGGANAHNLPLPLHSASDGAAGVEAAAYETPRGDKAFAPRASVCAQIKCSAYLLAAIATVAAWLLLLTLMDALAAGTTSEEWLTDPAIAAPVLVIGFLIFEVRLVLRGVRTATANVELFVSLVVLHMASGWYTALRLGFATPAQRPLEAVHALLLYAMLLTLVYLRHRLAHNLPARVHTLENEVREQRVQYEAVCSLLQRRSDVDADIESDYEGDEREHLIVPPTPVFVPDAIKGRPEKVLPHALKGMGYDSVRASKIAQRIRKKGYSLAAYYDDLRVAFPELQLYLAQHERNDDNPDGGKPDVTSGLGADDEYRRSIGAMFAVYWLMRIGIDGERGFSFGVDDEWVPHEVPARDDMTEEGGGRAQSKQGSGMGGGASKAGGSKAGSKLKDPTKRLAFYEKQDWSRLQQLLIDSGMLVKDTSEIGGVRVSVERTVAMLALTAFHDVMKVQALLPTVDAAHAPYEGFKAGDTINDHDLALAYVLDHCPEVLPSCAAQSEDDQRTIRFTQSKMGFNHGWLVQGEAPPSPLFAKFKSVMLSEGVAPADVAFYFVHWLTDLAGAEPSPLGGAEKFVLKFPHAVLDSFIRSFAVLNELAVKTETQVMEEYLARTWEEAPSLHALGPAPSGDDGVALMRLALQAQTADKQLAILSAFRSLPEEDSKVLREEMARTGIDGQIFTRGPPFSASSGPAILVYYSPAFVRTLAPGHALEALRVLAEVYRRARQMWPIAMTESGDASHAVTIRIDQIKELKLPEIQAVFAQGESWMLCRKNDNEAVVERHSLDYIATDAAKSDKDKGATVLKFWRLEKDAGSRGSGQSRMSRYSKAGSKASKSSRTSQGVCFAAAPDSVISISAASRSGHESPNSDGPSPRGLPPPAKILEQQMLAARS